MTRRLVVRVTLALLAASAGLGLALTLAPPGHEGAAERAYVLFLGALGVLLATRELRRPAGAPSFARPRRRAPAPARPRQLEQLERLVSTSVSTAGEAHFRLRPLLRRIALARVPGAATNDEALRRALGDAGWDLLRADRAEPADRLARGIPLGELTAVVERLEQAG